MQRSRGGAGRRWGRPGRRQSSRLVAYQGNASAPSARPAYQSPASQPAGQRGRLTCFLSSRARKTGICISQKAFTSLFSFFGAAGRGHNIQSLCPPQKSSKSPKPPRPTPRMVNRSVEPKTALGSGSVCRWQALGVRSKAASSCAGTYPAATLAPRDSGQAGCAAEHRASQGHSQAHARL